MIFITAFLPEKIKLFAFLYTNQFFFEKNMGTAKKRKRTSAVASPSIKAESAPIPINTRALSLFFIRGFWLSIHRTSRRRKISCLEGAWKLYLCFA